MFRLTVGALGIVIIVCLAAACSSRQFSRPESTESPPAEKVAPKDDPVNVVVTENSVPTSLVVTLEISDSETTLVNAQFLRVLPRPLPDDDRDGLLRIVAEDSSGNDVGHALVMDRGFRAQEDGGLIEVKRRTVHVAIPLKQKPDRITVSGNTLDYEPTPIPLTGVVESFCRDYPRSYVCRPPNVDRTILQEN